jgi:hypothetical protein
MWNCWFGNRPAVQYFYSIVDLSRGGQPLQPFSTQPMDKPVLYVT